jgi:dihydroorotate dehydrogenase (fumarate)
MADLRARYLGLELRTPLVASPSPLTGTLDGLKRLEAAGAGAVVLPSLFEEDLAEEAREVDALLATGATDAEARAGYGAGAAAYLAVLEQAKASLSIPVIASLNGVSRGGWVRHAARLEQAGANGLVLFNRFYQPDLDVETLEVVPSLELSTSAELRLPLRWIAILHGRHRISLAASSGVHTAEDVTKALLAGADVAMTTSALLRNGPTTCLRSRPSSPAGSTGTATSRPTRSAAS